MPSARAEFGSSRRQIVPRRELLSKIQPRLVLVVGAAAQLKVVDLRSAARREWLDVVEFEERRFFTPAE
jgi:hypothetical protein